MVVDGAGTGGAGRALGGLEESKDARARASEIRGDGILWGSGETKRTEECWKMCS